MAAVIQSLNQLINTHKTCTNLLNDARFSYSWNRNKIHTNSSAKEYFQIVYTTKAML